MSNLNKHQQQFTEVAAAEFGDGATITRAQLVKLVEEKNLSWPSWLVCKQEYRAGRGQYTLPQMRLAPTSAVQKTEQLANVTPISIGAKTFKQHKLEDDSDVSIPNKFEGFVPFGFFKDMKRIIKSGVFYPVFVTGHSGNGKTLMVEQVCAELSRECIRVNVSVETDESDLIGGPTLIDGNVVNRDGPVIIAMKRGAVLLIDEVDRGSNKLMCLQGILEGKPYFNKKSGELVQPKQGFNIVATANTKGRGSDEGRYLSQILDDAFLERFPITVEQEFPEPKIERAILQPLITETDFVEKLVQWAEIVRKTFDAGGVDELISTRRLVHIAKAFTIFNDKTKAITFCVNRFDEDTKLAFIDLYKKIDCPEVAPVTAEEPKLEPPF